MGLRPTLGDEKRLLSSNHFPLEGPPFPLSSRAQPRDLQFHGPFLETRNLASPQNCHLDRSEA
jgi:hypothetical protein